MKPASVVGSIFAIMVLIGLVGALTNKAKKPQKPATKKPVATQKAQPQKTKMNPAFEAGFTVGFLMAKTGELKPSAEQVDAMARKQAFEAGDKGGRAYAFNWKTGFWMGWSSGD